MTRQEKSKVIKVLTAELAENSNLYLTDISGLNAATTSALRRACFKANIRLAVVKNTLLEKAMEASDKDFGDLPTILKGNTSVDGCLRFLNEIAKNIGKYKFQYVYMTMSQDKLMVKRTCCSL